MAGVIEQGDGVGQFSLLESRLRLQQHGLRRVGGFRIFLRELRELRFRAAPHLVLKSSHGGGISALLLRAGGGKLFAAQHKRDQNQKPLPAKRHASESKRHSTVTKA